MPYNEEEIRLAAQHITEPLEELLNWRWEDKKQMLLSEFARGKSEQTLTVLNELFTHTWDKDSAKYAPASVKKELGNFVKLTKEQKIFTSPPVPNQPTVVAIWWPWGHGSTISLRLTMLEEPYKYSETTFSNNPIVRLFQKTKRLVC